MQSTTQVRIERAKRMENPAPVTSVADPDHFHMDPDPDLDPVRRYDMDPDLGSWILAFLSILGKNPDYFLQVFMNDLLLE